MTDEQVTDEAIDRRTILSVLASVPVAGAGGCIGSGDEGSQDGTNDGEESTNGERDDGGSNDDTERPALSFDHPRTVEADEAFELAIEGLPAESTATITLTGEAGDESFEASTRIETGNGAVNLADATVVDGDVPSSLEVPTTVALVQFSEINAAYPATPTDTLTYEVTVGDESLGSTSLTRNRADVTAGEAPAHDDLVGQLFTPEGGSGPGVVVLHGSEGRPRPYTAARLAQNGYTALALQYFGGPGLPDDLIEVPLEYVQTAGEWLRDHDSTSGEQVGALGTSRGGELAMLVGSEFDVFGPVVSVVGSGVVWVGSASVTTFPGTSSWTLDGDPLPYVALREEELPYQTTADFFADSLAAASAEEVEAATIPVENISGPLLLVSGRQDEVWNSLQLQEIVTQRMEDNGRSEYEHLVYDEAGHFIYPPYYTVRGSTESEYYTPGGTERGNAEATHGYWPRVLETLSTLEQ